MLRHSVIGGVEELPRDRIPDGCKVVAYHADHAPSLHADESFDVLEAKGFRQCFTYNAHAFEVELVARIVRIAATGHRKALTREASGKQCAFSDA